MHTLIVCRTVGLLKNILVQIRAVRFKVTLQKTGINQLLAAYRAGELFNIQAIA